MTVLGALAIGVTMGFAIAGALLLRNEDKVLHAWHRRRAGKAPIAPRLGMAFWGLFAAINIAIAIDAGGIDRIIWVVLSLMFFEKFMRSYRRSRRTT